MCPASLGTMGLIAIHFIRQTKRVKLVFKLGPLKLRVDWSTKAIGSRKKRRH